MCLILMREMGGSAHWPYVGLKVCRGKQASHPVGKARSVRVRGCIGRDTVDSWSGVHVSSTLPPAAVTSAAIDFGAANGMAATPSLDVVPLETVLPPALQEICNERALHGCGPAMAGRSLGDNTYLERDIRRETVWLNLTRQRPICRGLSYA
jgi:hypothetical protein